MAGKKITGVCPKDGATPMCSDHPNKYPIDRSVGSRYGGVQIPTAETYLTQDELEALASEIKQKGSIRGTVPR